MKAKKKIAAKKKAPAKKKQKKASSRLEGEGSYTAARNYDRGTEDFVKRNRGKIAKMARDAEAALEGPEGKSLRAAEKKALKKARR